MIDHQKEHMEEFMQKAFDEVRTVSCERQLLVLVPLLYGLFLSLKCWLIIGSTLRVPVKEFKSVFIAQGRKVEIKRIKEGRSQVGDGGVQEIDNHWRKVLEQKDNEACVRENKLLEEINILKKKVLETLKCHLMMFFQLSL